MQDTVSKGKHSLLEQLESEGINWEEYIGFYSLRQHAFLREEPVTEIIYIHSKLMIVDDRFVVIGSANINDRSMLGTRDSEIAAIIEDENVFDSNLAGQPFKINKFAHDFRMKLFAEHFGAENPNEILDPVSKDFWNRWNERAQRNTEIYREIFSAEPDNEITTVR